MKVPNNTRRRADARRAKRTATRRAIEQQYTLKAGALEPKKLTHHGYAANLKMRKPGIQSGKTWKKRRAAARRARS